MDVLGIECETIIGYSGNQYRHHAWNKVYVNDYWFYVDVTWDDPTGGTPNYKYFNVTEQFMIDTKHHFTIDN
jgi:transglutaminase/protease-like cytokinesis protein 3